MQYISTRNKNETCTAPQAIVKGLANDGGLYTPCEIPTLSADAFETLCTMTYPQRAAYIMKQYLDEFSQDELSSYAESAYDNTRFRHEQVAPVKILGDGLSCLELWHGPTCAFKDMALQMLPYLLTGSLEKTGEKKTVCILVATSGDTGKGALEGFRDVQGTRIMVFYPKDGVSQVQELQMLTQEGENVSVCAVYGNFDDAQTGVKEIFSDRAFNQSLLDEGIILSSANSINWGRVLPQIVYYVSAYCDLINSGEISKGQTVNVCVPTGNFGNILAAFYAKQMGVPLGKLICASNHNNVLTEFIQTGTYDKNRTFYTTVSPSMDILISSNLERLLLSLTNGDDEKVASYMQSLQKQGKYQLEKEELDALKTNFIGYYCDDEKTKQVISNVWSQYGYLIDTHTAVAFDAVNQYRAETGDMAQTMVVSTASAFKFCESVLQALGAESSVSGLDALDKLSEITGQTVPAPLANLRGKEIRFHHVTEKGEMRQAVHDMLR